MLFVLSQRNHWSPRELLACAAADPRGLWGKCLNWEEGLQGEGLGNRRSLNGGHRARGVPWGETLRRGSLKPRKDTAVGSGEEGKAGMTSGVWLIRVAVHSYDSWRGRGKRGFFFFFINLLQSVCVTSFSYPCPWEGELSSRGFHKAGVLGRGTHWPWRQVQKQGVGVLPGHVCALRTGCWPDPVGCLKAGCVWAPPIQKAQSTRAWLGNLTMGWWASKRGCDPPKAPTPHLLQCEGLSSADGHSCEGRSSSALGRAGLSPGGGVGLRSHGWHSWDGPGRAARGRAGPAAESMQCLTVFGLALHRADVSWFVWHYELCDNYKNVKIELKVPSRQHEASSGPMCVFLLPLRV